MGNGLIFLHTFSIKTVADPGNGFFLDNQKVQEVMK